MARADTPEPPDLSRWSEQIADWEPEIAKLETLDREQPDPPGAVLLIGSSSIRLWKTAAEDLAPRPVIRRGYGGARYSDVAHYAERLVTPHRFRAAVVFVGNDILGRDDDKTPDEMERLFGYVADVITAHQPDAQVLCVDVRPMPSRFAAWPRIKEGNEALKRACDARPAVHYLDTTPHFLSDDGQQVREELYGSDRLHLAPEGYKLWSGLIKARLDDLLAE